MKSKGNHRKGIYELVAKYEDEVVKRLPQKGFYPFRKFRKAHREYEPLLRQIELQAVQGDKSLEMELYEALPDDKKKGIGTLLYDNNGSKPEEAMDRCLLHLIQQSPLYEYYKKIIHHLSAKDRRTFEANLTYAVYQGLDSEQRQRFSLLTVKRHILNLGFIELHRIGSFQNSADFFIQYPSLFKGLEEAMAALAARYVERSILSILNGDAEQTLCCLKRKVTAFYQRLHHDTKL